MLRTTKHVFVAALAFIVAEPCLAQGGVGINNPAPHASALLDLTSTSKGLLTPRMTTAQRTSIAAPATGLLVFDTSLNAFWYYDGATWVPLASGSAGWATTGNAGTVMGTHFIGTTDNVPFSFRVNGIAAGRIDHIGENASLGRSASAALTTGGGNVAVGDSAGASMTASTRNTFVGWNAGAAHNGSGWNTFVGANAGRACTGPNNTFIGAHAGIANSSGAGNSFLGLAAGMSNTTGGANSFVGYYAGNANVNGSGNT
ncbi:MAG: hypothetical protein JNM49_11450, partial [Flavobacteriales bacterium]|nr:hypothetical protein [Flavobacteriales bacterium]